mmetsp:Transcript_53894/g.100987  ORF Transcript_53894/g.100987 Transcript_53894/m.100987 type:complete len:345 (+) Transcript_53894:58-1092(+)
MGGDYAQTLLPSPANAVHSIRHQAVHVLSGILLTTLICASTLYLVVPELLTAGVLAYGIGLRHAVDADHIAAIDNTAKRLNTVNKPSALTGFFFALGHSTVVLIMCACVALGHQQAMQHMTNTIADESGLIAGIISGSFLLAVGGANLYTMRQLLLAWKAHRHGSHNHEHEHAIAGFCITCCPSLFSGITASWQMFPVGFVFGLGFDTSSEVALLAMVGLSNLEHPVYVMILPLMFLTGMCLIDTLNGLFMAWLYGTSSSHRQRLFFNIYLTGATAVMALFIGLVDLLGVLTKAESLKGPFWSNVQMLNDNFELVGFLLIGFFALSTVLAFSAYNYVAYLAPES